MWNVLLILLVLLSSWVSCGTASVSYDHKAIIVNGQRKILISGSIHYPRSTPEMWPDLIQKAKEGGVDVIQTYVFWNGHEPEEGKVSKVDSFLQIFIVFIICCYLANSFVSFSSIILKGGMI